MLIRHGRLLAKDALPPLASLVVAARLGQKTRVVVLGLRQSGRARDIGEHRRRFVPLADLGERMRVQAGGALVVILRISRGHLVEVGDSGLEIAQRQRRERPAVERVD